MEEMKELTAGQRSKFVTVIAWIFIVYFAYTSIAGIAGIIMTFMMPFGSLSEAIDHSSQSTLPIFFRLIREYSKALSFLYLAFYICGLISAIGLLKRRDWARQLFSVVLGISIVYTISGTVSMFSMELPVPAQVKANDVVFMENFLQMGKMVAGVFNIILI